MSGRIGIYVGRDVIRGVRVEERRIVARWGAERVDADRLELQLRECLLSLARGWRRPPVVVALGPGFTQTKRISGLPPLRDTRDVERLIRHGARRFFLGDADRMTLCAALRGDDVIAEAHDKTVVDSCAKAANSVRLRLRVVSTASVLAAMARTGKASHALDDYALDVEAAQSLLLQAVRRKRPGGQSIDPIEIAVGASRIPGSGVPAVAGLDLLGSEAARWRAVLAVGALSASLLLLAASPILASRYASARASRELQGMAAAHREAALVEHELARVSRIVGILGQRRSRGATATLAAITHALPGEAALVAVSVDSVGGSLVVVASEIMPVVAALDSAAAVGTAAVFGPVTRERVGDIEMERANIRLQWKSGTR